jgi:SAM-dependent methyltransferase
MSKDRFAEALSPLGYYEARPRPTADELERHYSEKYYQQAHGSYSLSYTEDELIYFKNIAKVALRTSSHLDLRKSLFDLGCGEGFFSKLFFDRDWQVFCCDFSEFGLSKHNPELLPFFVSGDLFELIKERQRAGHIYGLVNLQNVLEHVLDPVSLLVELKGLLGDHSAIRIRVPNDYSSFQRALLEQNKTVNTWFSPPEHLSYFNKDSLKNLFSHCGYKILSLQADFPIEIFICNEHSNYTRNRDLGKQANLTRIFCENHLIETSVDDYIKYSEAAGKLGFGRTLIAYISPVA